MTTTKKEIWALWLLSLFVAINMFIIGLILEVLAPASFRLYNFVKYYPYEIGALCLVFMILLIFKLVLGDD